MAAIMTHRERTAPAGSALDPARFDQAFIEIDALRLRLRQTLRGKDQACDLALACLLARGHLLIEDPPGLGKTTLAKGLAALVGGRFARIQCTPDLLPTDVTGFTLYNQQVRSFEFRPGPVFADVLLADEINRATPRTQSALLEAMGEGQVTSDGVTRVLARPFVVLATQNPIEFEGTFPLPEAQRDRFLVEIALGYPTPGEELQMLERLAGAHPIETLAAVVDGAALPALQQAIWAVHVDTTLRTYLVQLANATRTHADIAVGASPRATLALFRATQARAALAGREYAIPDDLKTLIMPVWRHRMVLHPESALRGRSAAQVLESIIAATPLALVDTE